MRFRPQTSVRQAWNRPTDTAERRRAMEFMAVYSRTAQAREGEPHRKSTAPPYQKRRLPPAVVSQRNRHPRTPRRCQQGAADTRDSWRHQKLNVHTLDSPQDHKPSMVAKPQPRYPMPASMPRFTARHFGIWQSSIDRLGFKAGSVYCFSVSTIKFVQQSNTWLIFRVIHLSYIVIFL